VNTLLAADIMLVGGIWKIVQLDSLLYKGIIIEIVAFYVNKFNIGIGLNYTFGLSSFL